jgi:glutamyl-tRNA reductase
VYTEEAITVNDVDKLIIENRKKRLAAMKKAKEIIENPEKLKKPVRKQMVRERMNRKQTVRKRKTI